MQPSTSASILGSSLNSDIPKNGVSDTINATAPGSKSKGIVTLNTFKLRFITRLDIIAIQAARGVARFQANPIAIVGTKAAANVPHPNALRIATRSPLNKAMLMV